MLRDLVAIRKSFAAGIDHVLSTGGGAGHGGATVSREQYDKLEAENKKLRFRIFHLLKSFDEVDGGAPGGGRAKAMPAMKMFVQAGSHHTFMVQVVAATLGAHIDIEAITEETRTSKAHAKINPTGRLPLLQVEEGTIAGSSAIIKYLCRLSGKLGGSNLSE